MPWIRHYVGFIARISWLIGWPRKKPIKTITAEQQEADLLAEAEAIFNNPDAFLVQEEALLAA